MNRIQRLAVISLAASLVQVAWGAFTRGSGSGYGCSDRWPLCENGLLPIGDWGGLLPRPEFEMVVEWTHRWIASIVFVLVVVVAVRTWRQYRDEGRLTRPAIAAVVMVVVQSLLGAAVVVNDLDADLVTVHLAGAMTLLALLSVLTVNAFYLSESANAPAPDAPVDRNWRWLLVAGAALTGLTLLAGSTVHDFHAFDGWPLPQGRLVPMMEVAKQTLHYLHRIIAAVGFLFLAWLSIVAVRRARPRVEVLLVHGAAALFTVNVGLGAVHVFTRVSSTINIVAHLGLAAASWTCLLCAVVVAKRHDEQAPSGAPGDDPVRGEPLDSASAREASEAVA